MAFYKQLVDGPFEGNACATLTALVKFVETLPQKKILCRHYDSASPCYTAGTIDNNKASAIRKTTVLKGLGFSFPDTPTKLRVHHLTFLASSEDADEMMHRITSLASGMVLQHRCGHGICHGTGSCVVPSHLQLGTQGDNRTQTVGHLLLESAQEELETETLLAVMGRVQALQDIF
jgi:hypothetical protein